MLVFLKDIEAKFMDNLKSDLYDVVSVSAEILLDDFVNFNYFVAYLQNFSKIEKAEDLDTSPTMGIKNNNNRIQTELNITYY